MKDTWDWVRIIARCPKCENLCSYETVDVNLESRCFPAHCKHCSWPHIIVLDPVRCLACNPSGPKMTCLHEKGRVTKYCWEKIIR
jgi:hypothetical protein